MADFKITAPGADTPTFSADAPAEAMNRPGVSAGTKDVWVKFPDPLVVPTLTAGTIDDSDYAALVVTGSNAPSGGNTAYAWQTSPDGETWTGVATTAGYDASALADGTQVRRGVSTGAQAMVYTPAIAISTGAGAPSPTTFVNVTPDAGRAWTSLSTDIADGTIFAVSNGTASMTASQVEGAATTTEAVSVDSDGTSQAEMIQIATAAPGTASQYVHIVQKTGEGAYGTVHTYGPFTVPAEGNFRGAGALAADGGEAQIDIASPFAADVPALSFAFSWIRGRRTGFSELWEFDRGGTRDGKNRMVNANSGAFYWNVSDGADESTVNTGVPMGFRPGDLLVMAGCVRSDGADGSLFDLSVYFNSGSSPGWRKINDATAIPGVRPIDVGGQMLSLIMGRYGVYFDIVFAEGEHDDDAQTVRDALVTGANVLTPSDTAWEIATGLTAAVKMRGGAGNFAAGQNAGTGPDGTVTAPEDFS